MFKFLSSVQQNVRNGRIYAESITITAFIVTNKDMAKNEIIDQIEVETKIASYDL